MIKERNPVVVILLTIITFGIYGLYWFYQTSKEVIGETGRDSSAVLWLIGLFIPIVNFIIMWKYSHAVEDVDDEYSGVILFILWIVFFPAAQYLIQSSLNAASG